jgi:uncharacterized protein YdcH (DUF465 family)
MNRYDNIPLSDATKKGMTLTIDDLAAIGRLLSLQDLANDEQFERIFDKLESVDRMLANHEKRIRFLEKRLNEHIQEHEKL